MESIEIKNFGPIKELKVEIKEINIFIGKTSSGKSTVAKLICIFNSNEFISTGDIDTFKKLIKEYNIDFEITDFTSIKYCKDDYYWSLSDHKLTNNYPLKGLAYLLRPIFEDVLSKRIPNDNVKLNKAMLSLLLLNTMNFDDLLIDSNLLSNNSKKTKEISRYITKIREIKDQISKGDYKNIEQVTDTIGKFYLVIRDEVEIFNPLYIPAERIILSMVAESVFGLLKNDVSLAKCIKDFGSRFENARKNIKEISIKLLNAQFSYKNNTNYITLEDGVTIKLEQASSGFQSLTPLYLVIEHTLNKKDLIKKCVVVEEPELNLYPTIQKSLIEFLIEKILESRDKLIITTHSPYVLTTIDNLIQAQNVSLVKPNLHNQINSLVSSKLWLDFKSVSSYYFEEGLCKSTMDDDTNSIGSSNIDDVSIEIGDTYEKLLELKYSNNVL